MEDSARREKVRKYEEFVDKRLKPDLIHAISQRDKVFEQQKIFADLRRNIENLEKNSVTSLRTLVNLGSEVYLQAEVPDTQRIFVDVGFGFHVEFTWSEALNYIEKREEKIARQIDEYTRLIASIKAQIKLHIVHNLRPHETDKKLRRTLKGSNVLEAKSLQSMFVKGFENYFNFRLRNSYQSGYFDVYQQAAQEMMKKNRD
ncbi:prefoldin alpha subunit [Vigna unguiculata]|uniref:Prefoldin alpha subunit n=1 Tax=Vigna unguiculata TaxID=3917 RepID=A0A4D6NBU6_VIGUN|nr:prefoldin alpha subunit [Vigna unguiculata]